MADFPTDEEDVIEVSTSQPIDGLGGDDHIFVATDYGGSVNFLGGGGNDTLEGGSGWDSLEGGSGDDLLIAGEDKRTSSRSEVMDYLHGGDGNDTLKGGGGDKLYGGDGNDVLSDELIEGMITQGYGINIFGDDGDDEFYVDHSGTGSVAGGDGFDRLFLGVRFSNLQIYDVEEVHYTGESGFGSATISGRNVLFYGGEYNDTIVVGAYGSATISGGAGNDHLKTSWGNDLLNGGMGNDTMEGGLNDDTYIVDRSGDIVIEQVDGGIDTIVTELTGYDLPDHVENITYIGASRFRGEGTALNNAFTGSEGDDDFDGGAGFDTLRGGGGDDALYGGGDGDELFGGAGNDLLDGGDGRDEMSGGEGDDEYFVDDRRDSITEEEDAGEDTVYLSIAEYVLPEHLERAIFEGRNTSVEITGNDSDNRLRGGEEDDTLDGGAGADRMSGQQGDDSYYVDHEDDRVVEGRNKGDDHVETTLAEYDLEKNVEDVTYVGTSDFASKGQGLDNDMRSGAGNDDLQGRSGDDTLSSGAGNDTLDGGKGDDVLEGGEGDDVYHVDSEDDVVSEARNEGTDQVLTTLEKYRLADNVELLRYDGDDDFTGIGSERDNRIEADSGDDVLKGSKGNDYLSGDHGRDMLKGGSGNDTLIGGRDRDILHGGNGADEFHFARKGDRDRVRDFDAEEDLIVILSGASAYSDLTISQDGKNTVIDYGRKADEIILANVDVPELTEDHFLFA